MLHVLQPTFKPVLYWTNQVVASWVNADFWLDKITRESRHTRKLHDLMQNKFALGKTLHMKRFAANLFLGS